MSVLDLTDYRAQVARAHLIPPTPVGGLPPARRASELPEPAPVAWLIDQVWPAGEFGLLVGDGGAFKSSVSIHMACAVAGGHRLFDEYACRPGPALLISAEDHQDIVLMRARAFCAGHGWPASTLQNLHILAEAGPTLGDALWCQHIAAEVARIRPRIIVLDPWAELMGGDENSNSDARPAIKFIRHVAASVGAAVVLVHHAGKMREGGRALDRIRGASALPSAARVIWFFDFSEAGLTVENLKHSRAPRLPAFQLDRDIVTAPDNRAQWRSARLGRRQVEDPLQQKIILQLMQAPNGERSFNELQELLNVRRITLRATLDVMLKANRITQREGARRAQLFSRVRPAAPSSDDWFPPVPTESGTSGRHSPSANSDLVPDADAPPFRGVQSGNQSSRGGADSGDRPRNGSSTATESDQTELVESVAESELLARLEERRGIAAS